MTEQNISREISWLCTMMLFGFSFLISPVAAWSTTQGDIVTQTSAMVLVGMYALAGMQYMSHMHHHNELFENRGKKVINLVFD